MKNDQQPSTSLSGSHGKGKSKQGKGKGIGKTSAKAAAAAKARAEANTAVEDNKETTATLPVKGKGKGQGKTSANHSRSPMLNRFPKKTGDLHQVDGICDETSSSSSESLPSTVVVSQESSDLLAGAHTRDIDSHSDTSSRAEEMHFVQYTQKELEEQIFQCVPINEGWPTLAEATGSIGHEYTEPLMRPDFDRPDMRVSDGSMGHTSEYSESSIDVDEEVRRREYFFQK